jgi:glycosyltransferase involved in cell wall biosynthesis
MRLGFHGNPGNYPLMLARALRHLGHDVVFTLASDAPLDRPENRYADLLPPYPGWIHDFAPLRAGEARAACVELLRGCDVVMLSDAGPALAGAIGRPAVALLTGADVFHLAARGNAREVEQQRAGIARSVLVAHFARGLVPEGDRVLDELGVKDDRRLMLLMSDTDRVTLAPSPGNATVRAFCAARLNWRRPIPPGLAELDYKGTDVMVRGLGLFLREHGPCLEVRLVTKGLHVAETMALVHAEGIADRVTWLVEMSQRAVLEEFRAADIVFDQLDRSVVAMAGLDAMATGRPLIANARPEVIDAEVGAPSPVCQARTPVEVAAQLRRLVFDAAERERVGLASRRYVELHFSAASAARRLADRLGTLL